MDVHGELTTEEELQEGPDPVLVAFLRLAHCEIVRDADGNDTGDREVFFDLDGSGRSLLRTGSEHFEDCERLIEDLFKAVATVLEGSARLKKALAKIEAGLVDA